MSDFKEWLSNPKNPMFGYRNTPRVEFAEMAWKHQDSKIKELEKKLAELKSFWKPVIDKFETKYPNAGNANTLALTALTEAFDIHCRNEELEKKLALAVELIHWLRLQVDNNDKFNTVMTDKIDETLKQIKGEV